MTTIKDIYNYINEIAPYHLQESYDNSGLCVGNGNTEVTKALVALDVTKDIIAEEISDNAQYRTYIRNISFREGVLTSEAKDKEAESVYEMYYEFRENVSKMSGYRTLAINRGEKEKILSIKIETPEDKILSYL